MVANPTWSTAVVTFPFGSLIEARVASQFGTVIEAESGVLSNGLYMDNNE
jgi:hypothetical protein